VRLPALAAAALLAALPAAAQPSPAVFFGGHSTTIAFDGPEGPAALTLALDLDQTGWMHTEPLPGGRLAATTRVIYRWWIAEDGRLCVLHSPAPQGYGGRSGWSCYLLAEAPQGGLTFRLADGRVLPRLRHLPGNVLTAEAQDFLRQIRAQGVAPPTPQPPETPPPP